MKPVGYYRREFEENKLDGGKDLIQVKIAIH